MSSPPWSSRNGQTLERIRNTRSRDVRPKVTRIPLPERIKWILPWRPSSLPCHALRVLGRPDLVHELRKIFLTGEMPKGMTEGKQRTDRIAAHVLGHSEAAPGAMIGGVKFRGLLPRKQLLLNIPVHLPPPGHEGHWPQYHHSRGTDVAEGGLLSTTF